MEDLKPMHTIKLCKFGEQPNGWLPMEGSTNPHYQYYVNPKAE